MRDLQQKIRAAIAGLSLDAAREAEIVEELSQHLRDREEEMLAEGMRAEQVEEALLREVHDHRFISGLKATIAKEEPVFAPGADDGESLAARIGMDLRYAARMLVQNPGFAVVVIVSLGLGIGANTAIFQLLNAVRLRMVPVAAPEQLAAVQIVDSPHCCRGDFYSAHADLTGDIWNEMRKQQQGFSGIAAWYPKRLGLGRGGEVRTVNAVMVSGNFFEALGVRPWVGRLISTADDTRGCGAKSAVVSYGFWQKEFGGESVGGLDKKVTLDGFPFDVIGVTPANFYGLEVGQAFDVAIPLCSEAVFATNGSLWDKPAAWWITTIGRLKPGWTMERSSAQLKAISPGIFAATVPAEFDSQARQDYLGFRLGAVSAANGFSTLRSQYQEPLWLLLALSGLVLLIACANLANLLLARASARQREMALRLTLGASRGRLVRQLLTESLLLAGLGAAAGLGVAQILSRALIGFLSTQQDRVFLELTMDWRVVGFTAGLASLACRLFGLTPALQASSTDPGVVLKASGRGLSAAGESVLLRRALVVAQVALSLVLLMGALLFMRTFQNLMTVNAGFEANHVLTANFDYSAMKRTDENQMEFKRNLLARVQAIPGVSTAAEALITPLGHVHWDDNVDIPNGPRRQDVLFNRVSPGYFRTMETPLVMGRDFGSSDTPKAPRMAIVNQTFTRRLLGSGNPIGKIFSAAGKPNETFQVIGVVKDSKYYSLRENPLPTVFVSFTQANGPEPNSTIMIRSNEEPAALMAGIKSMASQIDPGMTLTFRVLKTQIREGLLRERLMATLSSFFGGLATVLAMIGLYGVISYLVVRRRSEIGLRMALGATRGDVLALVLREVGILLGIGLAIGTALALAGGSVASSLLYGLKPRDPLTLAAAIGGMILVAVTASLLPARRGASVDPMVALREE